MDLILVWSVESNGAKFVVVCCDLRFRECREMEVILESISGVEVSVLHVFCFFCACDM